MEKIQSIEDIRISTATIGEAGIEREVNIQPEKFEEILCNEDLQVRQPLHIHYVLTRKGDTIHAAVHLEGKIHTFCSRCLVPMTYAFKRNLNTDYLPAPPDIPDDYEPERQSAEIGYYRKDITLGEYIISEMVLALPLNYVCSPDCKGLCQHCGANLNQGPCRCEKPLDPRLQKLAEIKNTIRR